MEDHPLGVVVEYSVVSPPSWKNMPCVDAMSLLLFACIMLSPAQSGKRIQKLPVSFACIHIIVRSGSQG